MAVRPDPQVRAPLPVSPRLAVVVARCGLYSSLAFIPVPNFAEVHTRAHTHMALTLGTYPDAAVNHCMS